MARRGRHGIAGSGADVRICVLGSGSKGNSILVRSRRATVLVDAGFSARETERRLELVGVEARELAAIVLTHEHGDHTRGSGVLARRHGIAVHLTEATRRACGRLFRGSEKVLEYRPGTAFDVRDLRVEPFATVHDAADPVAIALVEVESGTRIGIATDLGRPTAIVRHALAGCDFLVLEANHDETLLHQSSYPATVKSRIASSHGHLSNSAAARLALELLHPRLAGILLAHLSGECNTPELARTTVAEALADAGYRGFLGVAGQDEPTEIFRVEALRRTRGPEQLSLL